MWKPPYKIKIISSKPTEKQIETGKERLNLLFSELEWYFIKKKDTNNYHFLAGKKLFWTNVIPIYYLLINCIKPNYY